MNEQKLRSEIHLGNNFDPTEKLAFSTSTTKDRAISQNLEFFADLAADGLFVPVQPDWSVADLNNAVGFEFDLSLLDVEAASDAERIAKQNAGWAAQVAEMSAYATEHNVKTYHVVRPAMRLVVETGGSAREGARQSRLARRSGRGRMS